MKAYKTSQGVWQISFMENYKRTTIYLGKKHTVASADRIAKVVTAILDCRNRGDTMPIDLMRKIESLPDRVRQTLIRLSLVGKAVEMTLGELCQRHAVTKAHMKKDTIYAYSLWQRYLCDYFGVDCPVADIGVLDAEKFLIHCSKWMGPVTISRGSRLCGAVFRFAVDKEWTRFNPFKGIVKRVDTNDSRHYYIDRDTINELLKYCSTDTERLLIVLA